MTHSAAAHKIIVQGDECLEFTLERTTRRKTVGIFVAPDGTVSVLAPRAADDERVEHILRRRMSWIRRARRAAEALPPPPVPRQWVNGETHRYLGRQYRLNIVEGSDQSVKLLGAYFVVTVPDVCDRDNVGRLMREWYQSHAQTLLTGRVKSTIASTTWLDVDVPPITIRPMQKRWGSTTRKGRITLNVDLVKLSLSCIDYVVAHELVHLKIPNHSPAYWRMLSRVMPDWKRWQERLWRIEI